jgi:hypothetical protein
VVVGIPSGYYPGLNLSDVNNEETGISGTLQLEVNGGAYGNNVKMLTLDIKI